MTVKDIPIASNELASLRSRAIILKWNLSYLDCFMLCKQSRFLSLELLISLWRWTHNMSKGMINNPNLQPNPTINWWIVGILLFTFHVVYILADCYAGSNGLSCHPPSENDPPEEDDFEDWLDNAYSFSITLLNNWSPLSTGPANTSRHPCLASHLLPPLSIFISASLGPVQDSLEILYLDHKKPLQKRHGSTRSIISLILTFIQTTYSTMTSPLLSIPSQDSFCSTDLCTVESHMVSISSLCQLSIVMESLRRLMIVSDTRVVFQSRHACSFDSGGLCWLTTSNGTSRCVMNVKSTRPKSSIFHLPYLRWADYSIRFILIWW